MGVEAKPDCNFSALGGTSPHEADDARYRQYRAEWEGRPRRFEAGAFPVHLDLEATSRCNLKCTFCDKLPFLPREKLGDMDFGLFGRILDEGREHGLCGLKLSYRGEPLLHPRIADMVRKAKDCGVIDVYFNTNGMLLTETMAAQLMDAGLDRVSISVEGTDANAFEAARVGAKFERIKANAARLIELRERRRLDHPKVRIQTVALPGLDLTAYAAYWSAYCDQTAAIDYKDPATLPEQAREAPGWACPQPWQRLTIEWDGTVHPCNNDDQARALVGNAREMSIAECWRASCVEGLRNLHQAGRSHLAEACAGCPWRAAQVAKAQADVGHQP